MTGTETRLGEVAAAPWHAIQAERDLVGVAVGFACGARLVDDLLDLEALYDLRLRRLIETAIASPDQPDVDLSRFDSGDGPRLTTWTWHLFPHELCRIVHVASVTGESVMLVAEMVADIPCDPSPTSVRMWAAEVHEAARRRTALEKAMALHQRILDGDSAAVDWLLAPARVA